MIKKPKITHFFRLGEKMLLSTLLVLSLNVHAGGIPVCCYDVDLDFYMDVESYKNGTIPVFEGTAEYVQMRTKLYEINIERYKSMQATKKENDHEQTN